MKPPRPPTYEVATLAILLSWNLVANLLVPDAAALALSLLAVTLLLILARRSGASWASLGLRRDSVGRGLEAGLIAMGVVVVAISVITAIPGTREYLADARVAGVGVGEMLYETLVRIPIGTALAEEIAFRGVVLGMLLAWVSPLRAVWFSSVLFGLWHVLPAIDALDTNPAADIASGALATFGEVAIQVVATALAGVVFAWLRMRSKSIAAPILAHWAVNGAAYLAAWLVVRNGWT